MSLFSLKAEEMRALQAKIAEEQKEIEKPERELLRERVADLEEKLETDEVLRQFIGMANQMKRGDVIGVVGHPGKTKRGELSIFPTAMQLLTPCLHMRPKATSHQVGLSDMETRYRQRYLDLMLNPGTRDSYEHAVSQWAEACLVLAQCATDPAAPSTSGLAARQAPHPQKICAVF